MQIQVLKSKINATVTGASKGYEGSITIGTDIMRGAGLYAYEKVEVNARDHDSRISTYVLEGKPGQIELNGGAAQFFKKGDKIHINCFCFMESEPGYEPDVINLWK